MIPLASIESAVQGPAGIPLAFLIGMVSFFSPCVLPLVPGYLSYMSGVSGEELASGTRRPRVVVAALLFVLGLAIVLTGLGASATFLGDILFGDDGGNLRVLELAGGIVVILMGLIFVSTLAVKPLVAGMASDNPVVRRSSGMLLATVRFLTAERSMKRQWTPGVVGALPLGAAFGIGWTPCVGAGMAAILNLAIQEESLGRGALLMFVFSLGLGSWFVIAALAFRKATRAFGVVRRHIRAVVVGGGGLMVLIGSLMVANLWDDVLAPVRRLTQDFQLPFFG